MSTRKPWHDWFDEHGNYLGQRSARTGPDVVPKKLPQFEPSKAAQPLYATNWHQCHACGCTFRDSELRKRDVLDEVLKLKSEVHECVDAARCANFKKHREEQLLRERGLSPDVPINGKASKP